MTVLKLLDFEAWSEALNEFVPLRWLGHANHASKLGLNIICGTIKAGKKVLYYWSLDDFLPMECMFSLEILRVNVLSSSVLYLSTENNGGKFKIWWLIETLLTKQIGVCQLI